MGDRKMRSEAREQIIECLEEGYRGYYCDLHHEVFNILVQAYHYYMADGKPVL